MWNYTWLRRRFRSSGNEFLFYISEKGKWRIEDESRGYFTRYIYIYLLWKFNARESATRWSCRLLRNRSLLLSSFSPLSFWSTKNFDHYISSFPSPFSRGKIIHEEQKRVLIYLQIEQEHCFERETSQSVKIIKPIRMDQPESKGNYRSNHRTNKSRSTVMASGILSITYFLSVSETAFSD